MVTSLFAKTAISAAIAGLLAPLSAAAADKVPQSSKAKPHRGVLLQQFGLVNIDSGQGLRVNIAFQDIPDGTPAGCDVTATVFAADGSVLVQERGQVTPTQSHMLDFDPRTAQALRANVAAVDSPDNTNPPDIRPERVTPCAVLSTLEVYDATTGETRVLMLPAKELLADIPDGTPGPPR